MSQTKTSTRALDHNHGTAYKWHVSVLLTAYMACYQSVLCGMPGAALLCWCSNFYAQIIKVDTTSIQFGNVGKKRFLRVYLPAKLPGTEISNAELDSPTIQADGHALCRWSSSFCVLPSPTLLGSAPWGTVGFILPMGNQQAECQTTDSL